MFPFHPTPCFEISAGSGCAKGGARKAAGVARQRRVRFEGPEQPVNLPASGGSGIPISFSNGEGITSAEFRMNYNRGWLISSRIDPLAGRIDIFSHFVGQIGQHGGFGVGEQFGDAARGSGTMQQGRGIA